MQGFRDGGKAVRKKWLLSAAVFAMLVMSLQAVAASAPKLLWKSEVSGGVVAVATTGKVAVADGTLVKAIGADGKQAWSWTAADDVRFMAYGNEGELYVAYANKLSRISESGAEEWTSSTRSVAYSLIVLPDGRPVLGYEHGVLCFEKNGGKLSWEHYAHEECDV